MIHGEGVLAVRLQGVHVKLLPHPLDYYEDKFALYVADYFDSF